MVQNDLSKVDLQSACDYLLNLSRKLPSNIRQEYLDALSLLRSAADTVEMTVPVTSYSHEKRPEKTDPLRLSEVTSRNRVIEIRPSKEELDAIYQAARRVEAENRRRSIEIELQHHLIEHREQERIKIAHYLHEHTLQELVSLMYVLSMASEEEPDGRKRETLQMAEGEARNLVVELRNFCNDLRPPVLNSFGLQTAIRSHVEDLIKQHPEIQFQMILDMDRGRLTDTVRLALYRIYQEAIDNVLEHSGARNVIISFVINQDQAILEIKDDGKGFEPDVEWERLAENGRLGLISIVERVGAINGKLSMAASPGCGTHISIWVPI